MARFIDGPKSVSNLPGDRIVSAREYGFLVAFDIDPDPLRPCAFPISLFLRVTEVSPDHDPQGPSLRFAGFVSDSYIALDGKSPDALDPGRTQFVEGTACPLTDTGMVRPAMSKPPAR